MKRILALSALTVISACVWAQNINPAPGVPSGLIPEVPNGSYNLVDTNLKVQLNGAGQGASANFVKKGLVGYGQGATQICWDGVWDCDDCKWVDIRNYVNGRLVPGSSQITELHLRADIENYVKVCVDTNLVYFHWMGDEQKQLCATINGMIGSNSAQWLGIVPTTPGASVDALKGVKDCFGCDISDKSIPLTWNFSYQATGSQGGAGGCTPQCPTPCPVHQQCNDGGTGQLCAMPCGNTGRFWQIPEKSNHNFQLKVCASPEFHQDDGHYKLDLALTAFPVVDCAPNVPCPPAPCGI